MNNHSLTVTPIIWSRKDKNGKHPIKIRITQGRESKYHSVGFSVGKSEWSERKRRVKTIHPNADEINFSIEQMLKNIEKNYSSNTSKKNYNSSNIIDYINGIINLKHQGNRYYSRKRYTTLLKHLLKFWGNENLNFYNLSSSFITEFRYYLEANIKPHGIQRDPSVNTINNYLKVLSSVINKAKEEGVYFGESPFRKGQIPNKKRPTKITLNKDDMWFLNSVHQDHNGMTKGMWDALNVFLFCFWSQGIRIGDCLQLKYGNFSDNYFDILTDKTEAKIRFPLTSSNLFRIIQYTDTLPEFYNWEKKLFVSTNLLEGEEDKRFIGYGNIPKKNPSEIEVLSAYSQFQIDRFYLFDHLSTSLDYASHQKQMSSKVDFYKDSKYDLFGKEFYFFMKENGNVFDQHFFKKFEDSKNLFNELSHQYFKNYCKKQENRNKFIFPFLRGLEDERGEKLMNKISSTTALINKNLKKIYERYDLVKFSSHYARHTFTSLSKDLGADIYDLKLWLGHTSVKTTEGYVNSVDSSSALKHNEIMKGLIGS